MKTVKHNHLTERKKQKTKPTYEPILFLISHLKLYKSGMIFTVISLIYCNYGVNKSECEG